MIKAGDVDVSIGLDNEHVCVGLDENVYVLVLTKYMFAQNHLDLVLVMIKMVRIWRVVQIPLSPPGGPLTN